MRIGNWGSGIKFQTSDERVLTFKGMKHSFSANTQKHKVMGGKKPLLEFTGPDLETVTFTIELNALLCHRPIAVEEKLLKRAQAGQHYPLVIGGRRILKQAMITKMSTGYDIVLKKGEIYSMKIDVTMTEYN
jgi:hypothetical protein